MQRSDFTLYLMARFAVVVDSCRLATEFPRATTWPAPAFGFLGLQQIVSNPLDFLSQQYSSYRPSSTCPQPPDHLHSSTNGSLNTARAPLLSLSRVLLPRMAAPPVPPKSPQQQQQQPPSVRQRANTFHVNASSPRLSPAVSISRAQGYRQPAGTDKAQRTWDREAASKGSSPVVARGQVEREREEAVQIGGQSKGKRRAVFCDLVVEDLGAGEEGDLQCAQGESTRAIVVQQEGAEGIARKSRATLVV